MKVKTTSKAIKGTPATRLWQCGYCDLQATLQGLEPFAYTCGVYGWNYDVYNVDGVIITTGYRNMVGQEIPRELIRKYEKKANELSEKYRWGDYEKLQKKREALRKKFIQELYKKD